MEWSKITWNLESVENASRISLIRKERSSCFLMKGKIFKQMFWKERNLKKMIRHGEILFFQIKNSQKKNINKTIHRTSHFYLKTLDNIRSLLKGITQSKNKIQSNSQNCSLTEFPWFCTTKITPKYLCKLPWK